MNDAVRELDVRREHGPGDCDSVGRLGEHQRQIIMTPMEPAAAKLLRQSEAVVLLDAVTDPITRNLVRALVTSLWRESQRQPPTADIDMEFVVRGAIRCCSQHALLRSVLADQVDDAL